MTDTPPPGTSRPGLALAALGASSFIITLDATALHVALPTIAHDLGASLTGLQWIANAYTLVFAGVLLTAGALADRLGARRVFFGALVFFVGASALCGLATSAAGLIVFRAFQGLGAAAIIPSSMALLVHANPDPRRRARALGIWSAISATALVAGPLLGGLLVGTVGWRPIFLLNLPVGLAALAAATISVGAPLPRPRAFDPAGQGLGIVALVGLVFAATEGRALGWTSPWVLGAATLGLCAALAFLRVERRHPDPMLPPELFASRPFSAAVATAFLYNLAYYGALFALSLSLQSAGTTPEGVGLLFAPMTAVTATGALLLGRVVARVGPQRPAAACLAVGALGSLGLLVFGLGAVPMLLAGVLLGVGGSTLPAIVAAALENVPGGRTGIGSGVLNAARQCGGAFGVALLGSLIGTGPGATPGLALTAVAAAFAAGALVALMGLRSGRPGGPASIGPASPAAPTNAGRT